MKIIITLEDTAEGVKVDVRREQPRILVARDRRNEPTPALRLAREVVSFIEHLKKQLAAGNLIDLPPQPPANGETLPPPEAAPPPAAPDPGAHPGL